MIDTALYEAVFNLLEGVVPEYDGAGVIREPSGSTITGIVPTNTYRCADGKFIVIGANGDSIFKRLCEKMGRPDMAADPRLDDNAGRVEHEAEIDEAIARWTEALESATALALLEEARVPSGPIYSVADMMVNEHFIARGLFEEVDVNGKALKIPAMIPKLSETPGRTDWAGPEAGCLQRRGVRRLAGPFSRRNVPPEGKGSPVGANLFAIGLCTKEARMNPLLRWRKPIANEFAPTGTGRRTASRRGAPQRRTASARSRFPPGPAPGRRITSAVACPVRNTRQHQQDARQKQAKVQRHAAQLRCVLAGD